MRLQIKSSRQITHCVPVICRSRRTDRGSYLLGTRRNLRRRPAPLAQVDSLRLQLETRVKFWIAGSMSIPTDQEIALRYRGRLLAEAQAVRTASAQSALDRRPVELDQQSVGRLSRMDAMQQQAMAAAQDTRRVARLRAIQAAIMRLDDGSFGWCSECGDFIGLSRLDLDPVLTCCIGCAR